MDADKAAAAAAIAANKTSGGPAAVSKAGHVEVVVHKQVVGGGSGDGAEEEEEELVRADAVIVAVPLSVLQEGAVEFDPPLSEVCVCVCVSCLVVGACGRRRCCCHIAVVVFREGGSCRWRFGLLLLLPVADVGAAAIAVVVSHLGDVLLHLLLVL